MPPEEGSPPAQEPKRAPPRVGPFGQMFLAKLKAAPNGTPDGALVMEMLQSTPVEQIKAAQAQASPKERNLLFSVIPNEQIKSVIGTASAELLAPTQPPTPAPSPTNGPPASILQTTYQNMPYPQAENDPDWAQKISKGSTIGITSPPPWEWGSVYDAQSEKEGSQNTPMGGLTGWVVDPSISGKDVWFVHPFGNDFEFYIVPDPQYEPLLAASNTGVTPGTGKIDSDYNGANTTAHKIGLEAAKGVLGVEIDQRLVPQSFQTTVSTGTRIAAFGRWIVDCGHD